MSRTKSRRRIAQGLPQYIHNAGTPLIPVRTRMRRPVSRSAGRILGAVLSSRRLSVGQFTYFHRLIGSLGRAYALGTASGIRIDPTIDMNYPYYSHN
jgi:hypothetical protein